MKPILTIAAALLLAACSQNDIIDTPDSTQPLTITVTDGGYTTTADRDAGAPQTRAVEDLTANATEFTAGDECGLYIVRSGEIVYDNVKLTANTAPDGTLAWQTEAGATLTGGFTGETYYLYYPYQAEMTGKTDPSSITDDAAFFDPLITGWIPKDDQSIYATGYTASDLMTATGTANKVGKTISLTFEMTHRMALAVIELPKTVYDFTNEGIDYYTVSTSADFTDSPAKPCRMADGTYRYIIHPAATTSPQITGSYADGTKEFTINPTATTAATFKTYKVDGGTSATPITVPYTMQIGDYFLSDGTLLPKNTDLSTTTQADKIIGIVLKAGRDNSGNWADNGTYTLKDGITSMPVHGYVLALYDANGGSRCQWGSYGTSVGCDRNTTTGFNGYSSTQTIVAFNNAQGGILQDAFPAAYHATNYETVCSAPVNTSGWFLPSGGQCQYWLEKKDVILRSIQNAGGDGWQNYYWSSSEDLNYGPNKYACDLYMYDGCVNFDSKRSDHAVRPVLAF